MTAIADRLARLRRHLAAAGLDGFLVPHSDEYQNEYLPPSAERLAWISGFTGSAGTAIVTADRAVIFVDGRYTLQVEAEVDGGLYEFRHLIEAPPEQWLRDELGAGKTVGYDPWCLTPVQRERFAKAVAAAGSRLSAASPSPLDLAWGAERPPVPAAPAEPHPERFSGAIPGEKRRKLAAALDEAGTDALVVSAPDSLAWLFDVRGGDVPHTPVTLAYGLLRRDGSADLFIDPAKIDAALTAHLGNQVAVRAPDELGPILDTLAGRTTRLDPATVPAWIQDRLESAKAVTRPDTDPVTLAKATKNPVELAGARAAHKRDARAMVEFLSWLDTAVIEGPVREIEASDRLYQCRAGGEHFRDLSFPSISAAGPNAALPHYRSSPATERALTQGTFYLIDSGAQYLDGTTDITRTVALGEVPAELKDRYTRVLKGHIALATAIFPKGTSGGQLDALARLPLWRVGVNYDHGTGHGVGSYLGVHEGPQRIAATAASSQPLLPGMIVSNEPGYYKTGAYGIRIENLVAVTPAEVPGAERDMLCFETLTLCPIDRRPIERALMSRDEIAWLDGYHARVRAALLPTLADAGTRAWLIAATEPL